MPHIDHITLVNDQKEVVISDWEVVGRAPVLIELYPTMTIGMCVAAVCKTGGGTGTVRLYDHFGFRSLGDVEFSGADLVGKKFDLSDMPTPNVDGIACLMLQMKTDGTGAAYCEAGVVELS